VAWGSTDAPRTAKQQVAALAGSMDPSFFESQFGFDLAEELPDSVASVVMIMRPRTADRVRFVLESGGVYSQKFRIKEFPTDRISPSVLD
jgi:hypothetical protein